LYCVVAQDCVLHIVSVYPLDGDRGGAWDKRGREVYRGVGEGGADSGIPNGVGRGRMQGMKCKEAGGNKNRAGTGAKG